MNGLWKRLRRPVALALLGIGLVVAPAYDQAAMAQEDPAAAEPGAGSGRVFDGYAGTVVLAFLAFFIVGKSARR